MDVFLCDLWRFTSIFFHFSDHNVRLFSVHIYDIARVIIIVIYCSIGLFLDKLNLLFSTGECISIAVVVGVSFAGFILTTTATTNTIIIIVCLMIKDEVKSS